MFEITLKDLDLSFTKLGGPVKKYGTRFDCFEVRVYDPATKAEWYASYMPASKLEAIEKLREIRAKLGDDTLMASVLESFDKMFRDQYDEASFDATYNDGE